jgi:hypothetical protein
VRTREVGRQASIHDMIRLHIGAQPNPHTYIHTNIHTHAPFHFLDFSEQLLHLLDQVHDVRIVREVLLVHHISHERFSGSKPTHNTQKERKKK